MADLELGALLDEYKKRMSDDLIRAVSSSYALIACADGHVDLKEVHRFFETLSGPGVLREFITAEFNQAFSQITDKLNHNYDEGYKQVIEDIAKFNGRTEESELIVKMAQAAIVADEKLEVSEEVALTKICNLLGLDPTKY